jgi:hypothetical protein
MQTVAQAMQSFVSSLEISEREERDAERQQGVLRGHLESALSVSEFLISGSFKRSTAIRPLNDVDLFVVLSATTHGSLGVAPPITTLRLIQQILDNAYPNKEHPIIQARSVNISFEGTGIAFDVVPALPAGPDGYRIPDREANAWIRTNPRVHAEHSTAANARAGDMAKPLVKALKHWNGTHPSKVVRSFHLELMTYDVLRQKPENYAIGLHDALAGLAVRVLRPMPDPAGVGPDVDAGLSTEERRLSAALFQAGAQTAAEAVDLATSGRTEEAHFLWRSLLGSAYPERGVRPAHYSSAQVAPMASARGPYAAPDAPARRFG